MSEKYFSITLRNILRPCLRYRRWHAVVPRASPTAIAPRAPRARARPGGAGEAR